MELDSYWIVHPLKPRDDSYDSPLIKTLVHTGLLLDQATSEIELVIPLLKRAFLKRQTRVILITAIEENRHIV